MTIVVHPLAINSFLATLLWLWLDSKCILSKITSLFISLMDTSQAKNHILTKGLVNWKKGWKRTTLNTWTFAGVVSMFDTNGIENGPNPGN